MIALLPLVTSWSDDPSSHRLTLAVAGRRNFQGFPVLCDGPPRNGNAAFRQHLRDLTIAQWLLGVFAAHELANFRAHGGRRLLAFLSGHVTREEVAELEH